MPSTDIDGCPILILRPLDVSRILESIAHDPNMSITDPLFIKLLQFKSEVVGMVTVARTRSLPVKWISESTPTGDSLESLFKAREPNRASDEASPGRTWMERPVDPEAQSPGS